MVNGWRFAFWRNRVMLALIAALLTLAIILTFTPGVTVQSDVEPGLENPVSEINR
jgi:hypothetical protein